MAKSVDPDQEQSDLSLHCLHMPYMSVTLVYEILDIYRKLLTWRSNDV